MSTISNPAFEGDAAKARRPLVKKAEIPTKLKIVK